MVSSITQADTVAMEHPPGVWLVTRFNLFHLFDSTGSLVSSLNTEHLALL